MENGYEQAKTYAAIASVTEPIWLTFSKRQSQAFFSIATWIRLTFVTVKSSLKSNKALFSFRLSIPSSFTQRVEHLCLSHDWAVFENPPNHLVQIHLQWKWLDTVQFVEDNTQPFVHLLTKTTTVQSPISNLQFQFASIYIMWFAFFFII